MIYMGKLGRFPILSFFSRFLIFQILVVKLYFKFFSLLPQKKNEVDRRMEQEFLPIKK